MSDSIFLQSRSSIFLENRYICLLMFHKTRNAQKVPRRRPTTPNQATVVKFHSGGVVMNVRWFQYERFERVNSFGGTAGLHKKEAGVKNYLHRLKKLRSNL